MAYRTKVFNTLYDNYLKQIMDFVGISLSDDPGCGLLKIVGADRKENGKNVPTYYRNIYNKDKIYTIVRSQDEFINYRSRREDLEYFNPFIKHKNALALLLMCTPVIYEKITDSAGDSEDDIIDVIVDDELNVTQDDIIKHVKIKQYPIEQKDDVNYYKYSVSMCGSDENEVSIVSLSDNKIAAILMLIIRVMSYFDEPVVALINNNYDFDTVETELKVLLEKYNKERELNRKDIKKIKFDDNIEVYQSDEFDLFDENSVEDALSTSNEPEEIEGTVDKETGTIDVTNIYRDAIPIYEKSDDDDIVDLEYF